MADKLPILPNNNYLYWALLSVLGTLSIIGGIFAHFMPEFPGDISVTLWIQSADNASLTAVMKGISSIFGDGGAVLTTIVVAAIVWWRLGRLESLIILLGGVFSIFNFAIKYAVNRPRPTSQLVQVLASEQQTSFPSGHACFTVIILGLVTYFVSHQLQNPSYRILLTVCAIIVTLIVGVSRVYLGAHWLSDVIGGYLVGGFFLVTLVWIYETLKIRLMKTHPNSL
jgi:membrane-associated phospholipid phosphatase